MFCFQSTSRLTSQLPQARFLRHIRGVRPVSKRQRKRSATAKPTGNPLALEIYHKYVTRKAKGVEPPKGDKTRVNIVSENLCDAIIERLAQSLKRHSNCDIIDINPGVGLWSSKLHDAIKPRSHILLEPDTEIYLPFLQPLLDKENSKYKLIPKSGILWDTLNIVKSKDYLPNHELFPEGDPRLEKPNDSLLLIGNLGYHPSKSFQGFPSIAMLMVHQLLSAVRAHSIFQSYGLVRMLLWIHDQEKKVIYPRVISHRKKLAVEAEISCENIYEIAGSDELASIHRREQMLDLEGAQSVYQKMKDSKTGTPANRISTLQEQAMHIPKSTVDGITGVVRPFLKELEEMESRYARREFCSYYDEDGEPVYLASDTALRGLRGKRRTPEYLKLLALRWRLNDSHSKNDRLDNLSSEYDSIVAERDMLEGISTTDTQEKRDQLQEQLSTWKSKVDRLPTVMHQLLWLRMDNRRAFRQDPPILLWDRREAEPLKVTEKEFFPQYEMCLLDFHPKSIWPVIQGKNFSNYDYVELILSSLFANHTNSVTHGLKALAPGADDWIIPRCPSLKNTAKGGAIDLDLLSIRTLNQDMIREIIEAWVNWPFRPTKAQMLARLGVKSGHTEDDDEFTPDKGALY